MSNLSIFKIGIGPSSSHTLGPLLIGNRFLKECPSSSVTRIHVALFGSLSYTGKGHLTDLAILWGLSGITPRELDSKIQEEIVALYQNHGILRLGRAKKVEISISFEKEFLKLHSNALTITAFEGQRKILSKTFYSIGGGFVKSEEEMLKGEVSSSAPLKLEVNTASDATKVAADFNNSLSQLSLAYELQFHSQNEIETYCRDIWQIMQEVYASGISSKQEVLPGALKLKRRAKKLFDRLKSCEDELCVLDFISMYAMAIAEENASGAKVITAPTNGACAVVPAVMLYLKNHTKHFSDAVATKFLLSAMMIGSFYAKNASISGAQAGCQAEIGSASSMAAGAMVDALGGSIEKCFIAAEIAMEHHLGLTCDPASGLVQVPCIERNAFGAIKAISAARMALARESSPLVSLDEVILTMNETGKDMHTKYKETSIGGLALTLDKRLC